MSLPIDRRRAAITSFDEETATVDAIASTFADVERRDSRGPYIERLDPRGLDMTSVVGVPLLDGHRQASARDVVGIVNAARVEKAGLVITVRLSQADDAAPTVTRIREGMLRLSVGYRVLKWAESIENGNRVRTATAWKLIEVSAVPVPADAGATFRSNPMENEELNNVMPEADAQRIRSLGELADLPPSIADGLITRNATVDEARTEIRAAMVARTAAVPRIRVQSPFAEDPAIQTRAMEEALHARVAGTAPTDAARQYMNFSLRDFARAAVERAGQSTRMMDTDQLFRAAMHTTSDFSNLLTGVGSRTLLASYAAAASPLKALARQGTRSDFRTGSALRLGELGALHKVSESGEIKATSRSEAIEGYALDTYGALFTISRKALINDDLGAFNDWARAAGQAAATTESDLLWGLLRSNPAMRDGKSLFHADHGNLLTGGLLSLVALSAARKALRTQTGLDGKTVIAVTPKVLLVGPELETLAEQLLTEINATSTEDVNPFGGKLSLAVEPRIDDDRWHLFADPASTPVFEYSYLAGAPGPQMASREGWETLSTEFRVHLDFGAGAIDHRGAVFNPGA